MAWAGLEYLRHHRDELSCPRVRNDSIQGAITQTQERGPEDVVSPRDVVRESRQVLDEDVSRSSSISGEPVTVDSVVARLGDQDKILIARQGDTVREDQTIDKDVDFPVWRAAVQPPRGAPFQQVTGCLLESPPMARNREVDRAVARDRDGERRSRVWVRRPRLLRLDRSVARYR